MPDSSPSNIVVATSARDRASSVGIAVGIACPRSPPSGSGEPGKVCIVLEVGKTCLTVPDIWGIVVSSTEDVDSLVTPVAVHDAVAVVEDTTYETWLECFHGEELVLFDYYARVDVRLLCFILDCIAINARSSDSMADLDHVEDSSIDRTAVRALHPRLETSMV